LPTRISDSNATDEDESDSRHDHRGDPEFACRDQREERHRERVGERRQRRRRAHAVDLGLAGLGQSLTGNRNGHEQESDESACHARAREEEIVQVLRRHASHREANALVARGCDTLPLRVGCPVAWME
jgi:hypothetical protein